MEWFWIAFCVLMVLGLVGAGGYFWYQTLTQNEIVLVNGFGKSYFGWKPLGENTYSATKWVVIMYLPVFPMERQVFKPLDSPESRLSPSIIEYVGALAGAGPSYQSLLYIYSREKPDRAEVFNTYLKTYILGPLALAAPLSLIWVLIWAKPYLPLGLLNSAWLPGILMILILAYTVYFFATILSAVRKTYCFREYEKRNQA